MILRVRSNAGIWRVDVPETATVQDVYSQIRETRPQVVYEMPLARDPACREALQEEVPLQQQGLAHGAMIHCRVDPATTMDVTAKTTTTATSSSSTGEEAAAPAAESATASNMRRVIAKDGTIKLVPSSEAAATTDKGFRKGMLPLRDMKMHWTREYCS